MYHSEHSTSPSINFFATSSFQTLRWLPEADDKIMMKMMNLRVKWNTKAFHERD